MIGCSIVEVRSWSVGVCCFSSAIFRKVLMLRYVAAILLYAFKPIVGAIGLFEFQFLEKAAISCDGETGLVVSHLLKQLEQVLIEVK